MTATIGINTDFLVVMNARMRRIDLFCKLVGPLAISLVALASMLTAIRVTLSMNLASVVIEYVCIAQVSSIVL